MSEFINTIDVIGDDALVDSFITRSITEYKDDSITYVGKDAFNSCFALEIVELPNVTQIDSGAFSNTAVKQMKLPKVTSLGERAFAYSSNVPPLDMPSLCSIGVNCFVGSGIKTIILRNTAQVCTLSNTNAFNATSIKTGTGYIYVPSSLIEDYKVATNWSTFAAQFRALEDYTVDGTVTGELDETKI